ncbi:transcription regulator [Liquorilactobacillus sucicola DSM 21376 = JCM 15457]|uniref:Transcription regulator n=2 Tax=Liquorilactobacillus sucicola TaxID=519050 RepID=A0A0R2E1E9_9LACO|nr:transcription regulator [Liquorilactobacillus sucicola DSM 21376 = JCM 15457]
MHAESKLTSDLIASSLNTNPSLARRMMSQLKKASLLDTTQGTASPKLSRPATQITIFDVYMATKPESPLLKVDKNTSQNCAVGHALPKVLNKYYLDIQSTAEAKMRRITIQDIINDVKMDIEHHQKESSMLNS